MPASTSLAGRRFGVYQMQTLLGVGGMGEVYRARDTKLERDVAIKILPSEVAEDPDRLARFDREARVLASLNHPHIGAIYGFEDATTSDGLRVRGLVLELVEGDTLADRLARGAIAAPEALAIAHQIVRALDAAHQQGIVHRDLKPANVKVTSTGVVKVLDFGLAKIVRADHGGDASMQTASIGGTREGAVVGTAPYMSPEQARGLPVDKRSDIWSFGCLLFEMLSGRKAFAGTTISDTIALILQQEPDWSALPANTPAGVLRLTKRCLEKDPERRLRDLGDADLALDVAAPVGGTRTARWRLWATLAAAGLALAIAAVVAVVLLRPPSAAPPGGRVRFQIPSPVPLTESGTFSLSPDGRRLAFGGADAKGIFRIWMRSFDSLETTAVPGLEGEDVNFMPPMIWSPDGRTIAFFIAGAIKRMDRTGGLPRTVCDVPGVGVGGSWNTSDVILVGNTSGGIVRCPAGGGAGTVITALSPALKDAAHMFPVFLPDNRHFLYLRASRTDPSESGLFIGDLDSSADGQSVERLVATPFGGGVARGPDGNLQVLFVRDGALLALPFDLERRAAAGEPVTVATGVGSFRDGAFFYAAGRTLVYREAVPQFQLTWLDRTGARKGQIGEPAELGGATLSPDETRVATWRLSALGRSSHELWLVDVARNASNRFPTEPEGDLPTWSPDGNTLYYVLGTRGASLHRKSIHGTAPAEMLRRPGTLDGVQVFGSVSLTTTPDGRFLAFPAEGGKTGADLWLQPVSGNGKAVPLLQQDFDQFESRFSPDYRWIAYTSNESGISEVFVSSLTRDPSTGVPTLGSRLIVSKGGGLSPRWRKDGRELLYQARGGVIMAAKVEGDTIGAPVELFRSPGIQADWSVSADGQRFLVGVPSRASAPAFTIELDWQTAR